MSLPAMRPEAASSTTLLDPLSERAFRAAPPAPAPVPDSPHVPSSRRIRSEPPTSERSPKSASSLLLQQQQATAAHYPLPLESEDDVSRVLDELFSALIHPPDDAKPSREHLSGLLSRIRLPTLCALFDMERLSGELLLKRQEERATIYIQDGRLIDVDRVDPGLTPRGMIGRLLAWEEGTFEFAVHPIDRPDRVGVSTTALLIDLAREADVERESRRNPPSGARGR